MWDEQVAALADRFRCVTVDLPGSGASNVEPWDSLSGTAATVAQVVRDGADGGAAHVVGLSLGGYVALALLAEHPERVRSAVVSGVTTVPLSPAWFYGPATRASLTLLRVPAFVRASAAMMRLPAESRAAFVADAARLDRPSARRISAELLHHRMPVLGSSAERLLAVAGDREAAPSAPGSPRSPPPAPPPLSSRAPPTHGTASTRTCSAARSRGWALDRALPAELEVVRPVARTAPPAA
jgi:pimeloyl-ACP methyl ester carboxylesterase